MRGIILAAGRGSRMGSHTDQKPKCCTMLRGKTLLQWQLEALRQAGVNEILVVGGYLSDRISGDFALCRNDEWQRTNMVSSLLCAYHWLRQTPCIVSYADIVYESEAIQKLMRSSDRLTILYDQNWLPLWRKRFLRPLDDAESFQLDGSGYLKDIGAKESSEGNIDGQYMGLLKFTPESAAWLMDLKLSHPEMIKSLDMTAMLRVFLADGKPVKAVPWDGPWCEVDSPSDLTVAEKVFASVGR